MTTYGYIRVSTDKQNVDSQELEIRKWADREGTYVDEYIRVTISSGKSLAERRIDELIETLESGDTLIVTELSRLGRSLSQIVRIVDDLSEKGVKLHVLKEGIHSSEDDAGDLDKVIKVGLFAILAEVERKLISQRTKEGLAAARARGQQLGARKGEKRKSKLDIHTAEIVELLKLKVPHNVIAEKYGVTRSGLNQWKKSRNISDLMTRTQ
jgi:DNA invertase Pin-like site-specific DNA recombinase